MSVEHELKTHGVYFDAIASGEKTFEVRRDDRGFQKGDVLVLVRMKQDAISRVWKYDCDGYSGDRKVQRRKITYVLTGGQFGIEPGFVALGLGKS